MALTVMDRFRPLRYLGSGGIPTLEVACETAETWSKGALVVTTGGYAVAGGDAPAINTILGIALEPVVAGELTGLIVPALPGVTFWGRVATGATGTTAPTAVLDRYLAADAGYDIYLGAVDVYFINEAATATPSVVILNFIDPVTTAFCAVEWTFGSSAFNAVT
jgi:hypothetical protein